MFPLTRPPKPVAATLLAIGLLCPFGVAAAPAATLAGAPDRRELSFEDRVAAQAAIAEVYWRHRLWPIENETPKPPRSAVIPDAAIRAQVDDYLRKSSALEVWWRRPVTAAQLQAEIDRMSRETRAPGMLRELFDALGNDPLLIAETLGRPALVDRLIRGWYASDGRFHEQTRREAEAAIRVDSDVDALRSVAPLSVETTFVRSEDALEPEGRLADGGVIELSPADWAARLSDLARGFGTRTDALPLRRAGALQEDSNRFFVSTVTSLRAGSMRVAVVSWPKRSFDAWWSAERAAVRPDVTTALASYTIHLPVVPTCGSDRWEGRYYGPEARWQHAAVWTGSEMIVWGGANGSVLNSGGRYDPATDTWTPTAVGPGTPEPRCGPSAVWTGSEMIVWGGSRDVVGSGTVNTGGRYDPATDTWTRTSTGANVPWTRWDHTAVWTGTEMIVWGGSHAGVAVNSGARYDPATDSWKPTSAGTAVPSARSRHTAVWTGREMIVWGGAYDSFPVDTGGRYDPATDRWTATPTSANVPTARVLHTAVWTGREMIVWGGYGPATSYANTGARFDPATNRWTPTSTAGGVAEKRAYHTALWTGTEMLVWGGFSGTRELGTGGRYDPTTDSWTGMTPDGGAPVARHFHTAVWTGAEMVVWGGYGGLQLGSGGRYDPATDSWVPTSTGTNVPEARSDHTAVWTGTEMIVWGGYGLGGSGQLSTGGRYEPATDRWSATAVDPLVSARYTHTAVWTGSEMIVWGGQDRPLHDVNSGGRYEPATDRWTVMTMTDAPEARSYHAAIWTGRALVVWGGSGGRHALNSGGVYSPSLDLWTPTSTGSNVPPPTFGSTAVWTGREMLVWGGYGNGGPTNTGGRYHPLTDSWRPIALDANTPAARESHTAVWTGAELIVWGGRDASSRPTNTGGRYSPRLDRWIATGVDDGVPTSRYAHSAIWTGTEMVVWGGFDEGFANTGSRYSPFTERWTPTSMPGNVPAGHGRHTAVWTGTTMLVWGGYPRTNELGLYFACPAIPIPPGGPPRPIESIRPAGRGLSLDSR